MRRLFLAALCLVAGAGVVVAQSSNPASLGHIIMNVLIAKALPKLTLTDTTNNRSAIVGVVDGFNASLDSAGGGITELRAGGVLHLAVGDTAGVRITNGKLAFVGSGASTPALIRSGAGLKVRLSDDSADAPLSASNLTLSGGATFSGLSAGTQVSCLGLDSGNALVLLASACGSGSVSVTAGTPNIVITPSPGTGTFTVGTTAALDTQSGNSAYTIVAGDAGKTVNRTNTVTQTDPVPQATGSFASGFSFAYQTATVGNTLTSTTSTINGIAGATGIKLGPQQAADFFSDGTNWHASLWLPQPQTQTSTLYLDDDLAWKTSQGTGAQVRATSPTLVTPALGTPTALVLTNATGLPATQVPAVLTPTPATTHTLTAPREYYACTGTCTVTVPVPAAGYEFCIFNDDNVSTAITLAALGSSAMYENSARTAYGTAGTGTLVLSAAAANKVCIVGRDSTHYWTLSYNGAVTVN